MDYETVQSLEEEALLQYVSQQLIAETRKIVERKIKHFDFEGYINSLTGYFAEAQELMRNGKNPAEGKQLNEDIQSEITKRMLKL